MKSMAAAKAGTSPKPATAKSGTISKSFSRQSGGAVSTGAAGSSVSGSPAGAMKRKPEENGEEIILSLQNKLLSRYLF
jgi:hypothetical protein